MIPAQAQCREAPPVWVLTLAQVISGVGTPLARHGRAMAVPSTVPNTWGPCWMVGITEESNRRTAQA